MAHESSWCSVDGRVSLEYLIPYYQSGEIAQCINILDHEKNKSYAMEIVCKDYT